MNLSEGTRRLALLLGVVGAILGGCASLSLFEDLGRERATHNRFLELANSDLAQIELKTLKANAVGKALPPWAIWGTKINSGGIGTIYWNENFEITYIETQDGKTLFPSAPSLWSYCLLVIFPIGGFLIPWAVIRAIGWVLTGFVQPSK